MMKLRFDPELLLRILLIGYLYGISSERKLVEERMHLAWHWFTGLGFDQKIFRPTSDFQWRIRIDFTQDEMHRRSIPRERHR
jgi:transposase